MSLAPWMYVVLLGLILLVYAQLLPKKVNETSGVNIVKELEQSMQMFTADMEEQNETLLQLFSNTKRDYEAHLVKLSERMEQLEKQNQQLVQELMHVRPIAAAEAFQAAPTMEKAASGASEQSAEPTALPHKPSFSPLLMNIKERYAELFRLYEQNKSVEYIARKLDLNKGEVNLIIQLAKQEEKTYV